MLASENNSKNKDDAMSDALLSIFQKHLPSQPSQSQLHHNIKDINHLIGALQTLDRRLKQCLQYCGDLSSLKDLCNCRFAGEPLFGVEIPIALLGTHFEMPYLDTIAQANGEESTRHFIQDKREEIADLLEQIFEKLDSREESSSMEQHCTTGKYF